MTIARAVVLFLVLTSTSQPHPVRSLSASTGVLPEPFSNVTAIRELADGSVLVTDATETSITLASIEKKTSVAVARRGQGPLEYPSIGTLIPLGGDSTVMVDNSQRSWLLLDGARPILRLYAIDTVVALARALSDRIPVAADSRGNLLLDVRRPIRAGSFQLGPMDSSVLALIPWNAKRVDTIGRLRMPPVRREERISNNGALVGFSNDYPPYAAGEQATLCSDGWLGIARLSPYRVDWRRPNGTWIRGAPLPIPLVPVDSREKAYYMERTTGGPSRTPKAPSTVANWPDAVPPIPLDAGLKCDGDGNLVIRHSASSRNAAPVYDVVDRVGALRFQLQLLQDSHVLGFGQRHVYVVRSDSDGVERIWRHLWP